MCVVQGRSESRRSVSERTVAKVGRGVSLSLDRSTCTVWLFNRGDFAIFVLSPTTSDVIKLLPAQAARVYRWTTESRTCKRRFLNVFWRYVALVVVLWHPASSASSSSASVTALR